MAREWRLLPTGRAAAAAVAGSERAREQCGRGKPKLTYAGERVVLKCQFSSRVEILLVFTVR